MGTPFGKLLFLETSEVDMSAELLTWILRNLAAQGIFARKYFFPLTNHNEAYGFRGAETPIALHIAERVLTLPLYPDLAMEDVDRICEIITE